MAAFQEKIDLDDRLAAEFSQIICQSLTRPEIAEMIRLLPTEQSPIIAATLATLKSNRAVVPTKEFLTEVLLRHANPDSETDMKLWAWALVKCIGRARRRNATLAAPRPGVAGILERFPNFFVWHVGGGCFAYRLDCEPDQYILMSSVGDAQIPEIDSESVALGRYAKNGELIYESASHSIDRVENWIEDECLNAREPLNVADYFAMCLGMPLEAWSFRKLRCETPCGKACCEVIDATASLLSHIQRARGADISELRDPVTAVARQIMDAYWQE